MQSAYAIGITVDDVSSEDSENSVTIEYTVTGDPNEDFTVTTYIEGGSTTVDRSGDGYIGSEGADEKGTKTMYLEPDKSGSFDVYADVESGEDSSTDTSSKTTVSFTKIKKDSPLKLCDDDVNIGRNVSLVFTIFSALGPVFGGLFFVGMTVADSARMEAKYQDDRRKVLLYGFSVPVSIGFLRVIGGFLIDSDISCYFPAGI